MRFGELFSKSWQEYRQNFKVFTIIFLLLSVIPAIIYYLVLISLNLKSPELGTVGFSEILSTIFQSKYLILIVFGIISALLGLFMSASFIYNSLYRKKEMSVKKTLLGGKKYFWKYLLFSIVSFIFLAGLFLLLIIPGIIFMVFWTFSSYILIGQNKGILESLKTSHEIVRGKWWHTLWFSLLFGLIMVGISLVFSIGGGIINLVINSTLITGFITKLFSLGASLITIPLGVLFLKNFYLDMKGGSKVKKTKNI